MTDQACPDPWGQATTDQAEDSKGFTDNFNDKLPDSEEYLATLETKLDKLKKKSSIAKELAARRSDEARRMLDSSAAALELFEDEDLNENSAINRRLFPEKQALTLSEIAKLLESDHLATQSEEQEENTEAATEEKN